jgi:hypothetical protein
VLNSLSFTYVDVISEIRTGETYPAEQLSFEVRNLSSPRLIVDPLKIELRRMLLRDAEVNNMEIWNSRADCNPFGIFSFKNSSLHLVQKTMEHIAASSLHSCVLLSCVFGERGNTNKTGRFLVLKLIVCATVMGRSAQVFREEQYPATGCSTGACK